MNRCLSEFAAAMNGTLWGDDVEFTGVSIDSRTCSRGDLFFAICGERFDGHQYLADAKVRGAAAAVVSSRQDVEMPQICVGDTVIGLQKAAAAWRRSFDIPVVAVAGSNGKTTTKEMIASILEQKSSCLSTKGTLNNHLGVPLTLLGMAKTHWAAVIEVGANHPGEVTELAKIVCPTVGVVTNAGAEHLEGFGTLEGAARAEGELFAALDKNSVAVMNADDEFIDLWKDMNCAERTLSFGLRESADIRPVGPIEISGVAGQSQAFSAITPCGIVNVGLSFAGSHNVRNALAALAVGSLLGCSIKEMEAGLREVQPVKGRLNIKSAASGGCIIDDSYNANPSSLETSLAVLSGVKGERWLALGNMAELGSASEQIGRAHV